MAPKNIKMDLSEFLTDDTFGASGESWADDFDPSDLQNNNATVDLGFQMPSQESQIPENGPFTARISSFPQQTTEDDIRSFFWDNLALIDQDVEDFYCPKDPDGSLKNFAFITFRSKDLLLDALTLNDQLIHDKAVYVSVAKPSKNQRVPRQSRFGGNREEDSFEWGAARGSARAPGGFRESREPREFRGPRDEEFEWSGARGSMQQPEPQQRSFRENREPREFRGPRDEEFEWSGARGSMQQPEPQQRSFRENREPREPRAPREDNFEWSGARGSMQQPEPQQRSFRENREPREPREPKNDDFAWGAARGSKVQPEVKKFTPKPKTDDFEWGARGSMLKKENVKPKATTTSSAPASTKTEKVVDGPKKSIFSVLQTEEDDNTESSASADVETVTKAASGLSLEEEDGWTIKK